MYDRQCHVDWCKNALYCVVKISVFLCVKDSDIRDTLWSQEKGVSVVIYYV